MPHAADTPQELLLTLAGAWNRLERRLDAQLSAIRGISFAEYRLLRTLADATGGKLSRVELAARVGLSASGVTRALRPLEKIGVVETVRSERDARLALAQLTAAGRDLVADSSAVLDDVTGTLLEHVPAAERTLAGLLQASMRP